MKILSINDVGIYQAIEIPDVKIYKISELVNCTIPPMFVLFNHELFTLYGSSYENINNEQINYSIYYGYSHEGILTYDFTNHKLISCTNSIEQMRQKFHEGTSSSSSSGSNSNK